MEVLFHLPVFDGPLDLLLHLISKNKVNIYDIPIAEILEQYLAYVEEMKDFDMEFASQFLTMAAQLMYIKSRMLLPSYEDEPEEDPRSQLVETLLEYQRMKKASDYLNSRAALGRDIFVKSPEWFDRDKNYPYSHDSGALISALFEMLKRSGRKMPPPVSAFKGMVGYEEIPLSGKMDDILRMLKKKRSAGFLDILRTAETRSEIVATFLALLELLKAGKIGISEQAGGDLFVLSNGEIYGDS